MRTMTCGVRTSFASLPYFPLYQIGRALRDIVIIRV